jgi:hypothetical protein
MYCTMPCASEGCCLIAHRCIIGPRRFYELIGRYACIKAPFFQAAGAGCPDRLRPVDWLRRVIGEMTSTLSRCRNAETPRISMI